MSNKKRDISFEEVIHSWLKDEWYLPFFDELKAKVSPKLIDDPDFSNEEENRLRWGLLYYVRAPMIGTLPQGIVWKIMDLKKIDLERTYIVPATDWLPITNNTYKFLNAVGNIEGDFDHTTKIREIRSNLPKNKINKKIILVASDIEGDLTILEGNHRAVAMISQALERGDEVVLKDVIIGICPQMKDYVWHIESRRSNIF